MAAKDEAKIRLTMEVKEFNQSAKEAESALKELRSEMRLNSEQMKTAGTSLEGLENKQRILAEESEQYEKKLEALRQKLAKTVEVYGENSTEAEKMRTTLNNAAAAYEKVKQESAAAEQELADFKTQMGDAGSESQDTRNELEKLSDSVKENKERMESLKDEYKNAVIQFGKGSDEANALESDMKDLAQEIRDGEDALEDLEKDAKTAAGQMDDLGDSADDAAEGFTTVKGAVSTFAGNLATELFDAAKDGVASLYNLADETREYRSEMAKLTSAAEDNGYSADFVKEKYLDMYAVLADETAANTTVSNFMAMQMSEEDLTTVLHAATGIWAKYGDSIPLDGLAESVNETANVGTVTGNLADALNWAGISEDDFNEKLAECSDTSDRQQLIVETLDDTYGDLADTYEENNEQVMDANRATAEYNDTMAELGEEIEPVTVAVKEGIADVTKAAIDLIDVDMEGAAEKVGDAFEYVADNIDTIIKVAEVGASALGAMFVVNKAAKFAESIKTLTTAFTAMKTAQAASTAATEAQTVAQTGLNAAMLANPYVLLAAGAAALTAALVTLYVQQGKNIEETYGLTEAQEENIEAINESKEACEEMVAAREEAIEGVDAEYDHLEDLNEELATLVDSNGDVVEGEEDRYNFIVGQLASGLDMEEDKVREIISANGDLTESIDQVIEKKRAEATLSAYEESYEEAIKNQADAYDEYAQAVSDVNDLEQEYNAFVAENKTVLETYNGLVAAHSSEAGTYAEMNREVIEGEQVLKDSLEEAQTALNDSKTTYDEYQNTIQKYEGLSSAIISGDTEKIEAALASLDESFVNATTGTREELEKQVQTYQEAYDAILAEVEAGSLEATDASVTYAKDMVDKSVAELDKFDEQAAMAGNAGVDSYAASILEGNATVLSSAQTIRNTAEAATQTDLSSEGSGATGTYVSGAKSVDVYTPFAKLTQSARSGALSVEFKSAGTQSAGEWNSGYNQLDAYNTAKAKALEGNSGAGSVSSFFSTTGWYLSQGLGSGMAGYDIASVAKRVANNALYAIKRTLGINSPSKEAYALGEFFDEGFANALDDGRDEIGEMSEGLADAAVSPLSGLSGTDYGISVQTDYQRNLEIVEGSRLQRQMAEVESMVDAIRNMRVVMNVNGKTFAESTAANFDTVNGTRQVLNGRNVALA